MYNVPISDNSVVGRERPILNHALLCHRCILITHGYLLTPKTVNFYKMI